MAFNRIVGDTDELTSNLGREQLDLFDSRIVVAIYRDTESAKRARSDADYVITAQSTTYLAIAVGSALSVFSSSADPPYLVTIEDPEFAVVGLKWLGDSDLLAVATSNAQLRIFSAILQKYVFSVNVGGEWGSSLLETYYNARTDAFTLLACPDSGTMHRTSLPAWRVQLSRISDGQDAPSRLNAALSAAFAKTVNLDVGREKRFVHAVLVSSSSAIGWCADGRIRQATVTLGGEKKMRVEEMRMVPRCSCLRLRLLCNDSILAVLTEEGRVKMVDWSMGVQVSELVFPRAAGESITDFAMVEWPAYPEEYERIVIMMKKGEDMEVQIRDLDDPQTVVYKREVVPGSYLLQLDAAAAADGERLATVIEPADSLQLFAEQNVIVRDIVETRPEQRLTRMINRGSFEEAEQFAIENKLDVQTVHVARVSHWLSELEKQAEEEEEEKRIYEGFMKALGRVDKDTMGDFVLAALPLLKTEKRIAHLLEYGETAGITDPAASVINAFAYNFATYRMVFGPGAVYGTIWERYQLYAEWDKQWMTLLSVGNVAEARIIWHRYPKEMGEAMQEGKMEELCETIGAMLKECPAQWEMVVDHLEVDVVPVAISSCGDTEGVYSLFIGLIVGIAEQLERRMPDNFPDNALYAVSAVERLINRLKSNALTSMKAAEFLLSSTKSVEIIEQMYRRSRDLRAIKRLKEVYECPLSYEQYNKYSMKEICHEILQRSVQNPKNLRDRIDKIARPFMEEHSLPVDETLLAHIEKVTSIARCHSSSSEPLDVHCLMVKEAIGSAALRAKAVLEIAGSAQIPWCAALAAAVQQVLQDKTIDERMKRAMAESKDRMRMASICVKLGLRREYLEEIMETTTAFQDFIRFILKGRDEENKDERSGMAAEAFSIFRRFFGKGDQRRGGGGGEREKREEEEREEGTMTVDQVENVCMMVEKEELTALHAYVDKQKIVDAALEMLVLREETADRAFEGDTEWEPRRCAYISAICSLIQRFRQGEGRWESVYDEMRRMGVLMTKYSVDTNLIVVRQPGMRVKLLHKFMRRGEAQLRECIELATVLGLSHDETYVALLQYSVPMRKKEEGKRGSASAAAAAGRVDDAEPDLTSGLYLSRKALRDVSSASPELLAHIVYVAEETMWRMIPSDGEYVMSAEECMHACDHADALAVILPEVARLDVDQLELARVLRLWGAVNLIRDTVLHMQQQQEGGEASSSRSNVSSSRRNSVEEEEEGAMEGISDGSEKNKKKEEERRVVEFGVPFPLSNRRRIGAYEGRLDNPIMNQECMMTAVCRVAFIINERPKGEGWEEEIDKMEGRWAELFNELTINGQHMLELQARVLYTVWGGNRETDMPLQPLTKDLSLRLLQLHPCDLPLLATIYATLDYPTMNQELLAMFKAVRRLKKSPQTMLNMCRLSQLIASRKEALAVLEEVRVGIERDGVVPAVDKEELDPNAAKTDEQQTLEYVHGYYTRALWEKRLGKRGVVAHQEGLKAVSEFAAKLIPPEMVREYLGDLPENKMSWTSPDVICPMTSPRDKKETTIAGGMQLYLGALLGGAIRAKDDAEREAFLVTADGTIELELNHPAYTQPVVRAHLYSTLMDYLEEDCCPYAHEVIQFMLAKAAQLATPNQRQWETAKKIADFVCLVPRAYPMRDEERLWYTERKAQKSTADMSCGESMVVEETHFIKMPDQSSTRLPFHLFRADTEAELSRYVVPIVWHEITLDALGDWSTLLREVYSLGGAEMKSSKMELKRPKLMTKAVMKYIKAAQEQNSSLSPDDMEWIQEKLYGEKNTMALLHTFGVEISHYVPAGPTRIQLLDLGYNVTKKYLKENTEENATRQKIQEHQLRLLESLREMKSKQLLQKAGIYNQETSPHVKNMDVLISRIYDRLINWDNPEDVEKKCALIKELATINEHTLERTHEEIVRLWLCGESGSGGEEELPDVDMNDTMGSSCGGFFGGAESKKEDEEVVSIPFYDEEITRIVHILRISRNKQSLVERVVLNYVNMEKPPGGEATHIRALASMLRGTTPHELEQWAPLSSDEYADQLYERIVKRLIEKSLGASGYSQYQKAAAQDVIGTQLPVFVRNLLMSTQRSKPGTVYLAAVLTLDMYVDGVVPVVDQKLMDHILSKLNGDKKYTMITQLLMFCSSKPAFRSNRNLNVLWGRTIDNVMRDLEEEDAPVALIHEWLLFALSCPTPANRALESLKRLMEKRGASKAGYLLKLASSFSKTASLPRGGPPSASNIEYPLNWQNTIMGMGEMDA